MFWSKKRAGDLAGAKRIEGAPSPRPSPIGRGSDAMRPSRDALRITHHAPVRQAQGRPRTTRHAPRYRYRPPRRGVLLLVVLTVLVLFVMLTVTYVIVATKERVAAKAALRYEQSGD